MPALPPPPEGDRSSRCAPGLAERPRIDPPIVPRLPGLRPSIEGVRVRLLPEAEPVVEAMEPRVLEARPRPPSD